MTLFNRSHPPKTSDWVRRALVREASNRLLTMKELQRSIAQMGEAVHRTTLAQRYYSRVVRRKPSLKRKSQKQTNV